MNLYFTRWGVLGLFVAFTFIATVAIAQTQFPDLTGRIVDEANLLSPENKAIVDEMLRKHEVETSNQVVVVTLQSLQNRAIKDFGAELGRHWGIGQTNKDNGVLLIIAPNERQVRIEVGVGLEGILTHTRASMIIQNQIIPPFRSGDRTKGVVDGVEEILDVLAAGVVPGSGGATDNGRAVLPPLFFFALFVAIILLIRRSGFRPLRSSRRMGRYAAGISSSGTEFSGRSNFSGGGGSFGGGGASGSW